MCIYSSSYMCLPLCVFFKPFLFILTILIPLCGCSAEWSTIWPWTGCKIIAASYVHQHSIVHVFLIYMYMYVADVVLLIYRDMPATCNCFWCCLTDIHVHVVSVCRTYSLVTCAPVFCIDHWWAGPLCTWWAVPRGQDSGPGTCKWLMRHCIHVVTYLHFYIFPSLFVIF